MEGMNRSELEALLNIKAEQVKSEEAVKKKQEELEQQRQAEVQRNRQEHLEAMESDAKKSVFEMLNNRLVEPITISDHWYDQDDGVGESIDNKWTMAREGEVIVFSKESRVDRFGWSGSKISHDDYVWLLVDGIDRPLVSKSKRDDVIQSGIAINLNVFDRGSWIDVKEALEDVQQSLLRKEMLDLSTKLLQQHGVRKRSGFTEDGQRINGQSARDTISIQASDEEQSAWRLIQVNDPFSGEFESFVIDYSNLWTQERFQIYLTPDNLRPRVWLPLGSQSSYGDIYTRHLELFNLGLEVIKSKISPALFDPKDTE